MILRDKNRHAARGSRVTGRGLGFIMDQPIQPLVSASTYKVRDDVEAAISCASSLDRAVFMAFTPGSRADELLDHLTVNTMNFARKADGTTPLMAACASGNKPLAELLLDLGCHALMKDDRGWTAVEHAAASPVQQDLGKLILERVHPPLDGDGKPVHAWDTCDHPPHCRFLDESLGWLICTNCALVLDEKALVMAGEPAGGSKNPWAVKAADAEYNAWRHDEMELSDAMHRLGVCDTRTRADVAGAKQRPGCLRVQAHSMRAHSHARAPTHSVCTYRWLIMRVQSSVDLLRVCGLCVIAR